MPQDSDARWERDFTVLFEHAGRLGFIPSTQGRTFIALRDDWCVTFRSEQDTTFPEGLSYQANMKKDNGMIEYSAPSGKSTSLYGAMVEASRYIRSRELAP